MNGLWAIAIQTSKEALRKKVLHISLIVGLLIIASTIAFSNQEQAHQIKILKDLCLSVVTLIGLIIAVYTSVGQIPDDVENKTIYPILSKPVSRLTLVVGKYIGCQMIVLLNIILMTVLFSLILMTKGSAIGPVMLKGIFLIYLELAILTSIAFFLSTFMTKTANATVIIIIFFVSHFFVRHVLEKAMISDSMGTRIIMKFFYYLAPHLENYNIRDFIVHNMTNIPFIGYLLPLTVQALIYIAIYLGLAFLIFRRKEI
jgi:ABC-type transport system involved in multi-copper enzyme maturation permease subunit